MQHVVLHGKPPTPVFTEADSVSVERPSVLVGDDTKDMVPFVDPVLKWFTICGRHLDELLHAMLSRPTPLPWLEPKSLFGTPSWRCVSRNVRHKQHPTHCMSQKSYRLLVDQGPLSNEEFWRAHQRQVDEEVAGNQAVGRSNARPELKRIAGAANHLEVTVTHDFIRDTFQKVEAASLCVPQFMEVFSIPVWSSSIGVWYLSIGLRKSFGGK